MKLVIQGNFVSFSNAPDAGQPGPLQLPDTHYFDKAFEPILVTGADGNEYNVIPSDQFK